MTFAPIWVPAAIALTGVGHSARAGEEQKGLQNRSRIAQEKAQQQAQAQAQSEARKAEEATNAANRKTPQIGSLLGDAQMDANKGAASTLLTGPQGIDPQRLKLGKTSLLGG